MFVLGDGPRSAGQLCSTGRQDGPSLSRHSPREDKVQVRGEGWIELYDNFYVWEFALTTLRLIRLINSNFAEDFLK